MELLIYTVIVFCCVLSFGTVIGLAVFSTAILDCLFKKDGLDVDDLPRFILFFVLLLIFQSCVFAVWKGVVS